MLYREDLRDVPDAEPLHPRERFCSCGLRCTRQRETIYRALAATRTHPTAEELYRLVRDADESLSLATVYNALEAFCERGLCRRLATTSGPARYDADLSDHLHVQDDDGGVHDVPPDLSRRFFDAVGPGLLREIAEATGLEVATARIDLSGEGREG